MGLLSCLGRHTITGMIIARGHQFTDWSADYRLFAKNRIDNTKIFAILRQQVLNELPADHMIIIHMDDTIIRKTGKKIPGTAWRRDPLGPPFHTNFVWGQRFIQLSMALPDNGLNSQSKAIPIDFHHCPSAKKPGKGADEAATTIFKEQQKISKLSKQGAERIELLRKELDKTGHKDRVLYVGVDGSYTNAAVLKSLAHKTVLIGRVRKDTKLYKLPDQQKQTGRKKIYGDPIATPEQIRQSHDVAWLPVLAWAAGKSHTFNVKVVKDLRWRSAGAAHTLQLVIIRPLAYRLTNSSKTLYREPAYLICTDNDLDIEKLLQAYLWRWEVEVNFRDEKTILGCGQAQVRNMYSAARAPEFSVAMYGMLKMAAHQNNKERDKAVLPRPLWDLAKENQRLATNEIINLFRAHLWADTDTKSLEGFIEKEHNARSRRNTSKPNVAAVFYYRK